MLGVLLFVPPVRWLLTRLIPIGTGPPDWLMKRSRWDFAITAYGSHGAVAKGRAIARHQDAGGER